MRAVVAKQLTEEVQRRRDVTKAVLETLEELKPAPGQLSLLRTCRTSRSVR